MTRFSAFLDACALVPIAQADTLLRLAQVGIYRPLWSEKVLQETVKAIEIIHPDIARSGAAEKQVNLMKDYFLDACVEDWKHLVDNVHVPDINDRHIVAAAFKGRADVIVTANIRDFPENELNKFGLSAQTPDEFLLNQLDLAPQTVMEVLRNQALAAKNPKLELSDLLNALEKCGASNFVREASRMLWRV